jgi:hypothetical protein
MRLRDCPPDLATTIAQESSESARSRLRTLAEGSVASISWHTIGTLTASSPLKAPQPGPVKFLS